MLKEKIIIRHLEEKDVEAAKALCAGVQREAAKDVIIVQLQRIILHPRSLVALFFFSVVNFYMFKKSALGALTNALSVFIVAEAVRFYIFWRKIRRVFSTGQDLLDPLKYYSQHKRFFLVAVVDGVVAATVAVRETDQLDEAKLFRMFVHPNYRRRGLASKLISSCHEECRKLGYRSVYIRTHDTNTNAMKCYEKAGYILVDKKTFASTAAYSFDTVHYTYSLE